MTQEVTPEGFVYTNEAASETSWTILKTWLESDFLAGALIPIPWQIGAQNRKVAQFGFRYDYEKDIVDMTTPTDPIPQPLRELLDIDPSFTQCIINQYEPDTLIPWHKDDLMFGPTISVFTFGEARNLWMRLASDHDVKCFFTPQHLSNYVLSGSARYEWEHMIPTGSGLRVSFTFRTHKDDS